MHAQTNFSILAHDRYFPGTMETKSSGLFGGMTLQPQQPLSQPATLSQPAVSQPTVSQPTVSQPTASQPTTSNADFADSFGLLTLDSQPPTTVRHVNRPWCSMCDHLM